MLEISLVGHLLIAQGPQNPPHTIDILKALSNFLLWKPSSLVLRSGVAYISTLWLLDTKEGISAAVTSPC